MRHLLLFSPQESDLGAISGDLRPNSPPILKAAMCRAADRTWLPISGTGRARWSEIPNLLSRLAAGNFRSAAGARNFAGRAERTESTLRQTGYYDPI